jgi:hypothetical protein
MADEDVSVVELERSRRQDMALLCPRLEPVLADEELD